MRKQRLKGIGQCHVVSGRDGTGIQIYLPSILCTFLYISLLPHLFAIILYDRRELQSS